MNGPDIDRDRRMVSPLLRPAGFRRPGWWLTRVALPAAVVVVGIVVSVVPAASQPGPRLLPPSPDVPGTNPAVQQWLKQREGLQIELNNALLTVQQLDPAAAGALANCERLATVTAALLVFPPPPEPKLSGPSRAGLEQFARASAACLGRDFATAQRLVADGLAARVVAQVEIDHVLDGE